MVVLMTINDELYVVYLCLINYKIICLIGIWRTTQENSTATRTKRALVLAN
jgi:hypothetical protein